MTPQAQKTCLDLLAAMVSPSQQWSEPVASLYCLAMQGWDDEVAIQAVRHAALHEQWRPAPVQLRTIAAKLVAAAPPAGAVREEIRTLLNRHGGRRAHLAQLSHPLVGIVADDMGGWLTLSHMETGQIDRAFPAAYERSVREFYESAAEELLSLPAAARRAALQPPAGNQKALAASIIIDPVPESKNA